jgi:hypothetical protein
VSNEQLADEIEGKFDLNAYPTLKRVVDILRAPSPAVLDPVVNGLQAKDFGANATDLIKRLKNRAATASAVGNTMPEYALSKEVTHLLEEAAAQIDHQINVGLAWKYTAKSNSIALRDAKTEFETKAALDPVTVERCAKVIAEISQREAGMTDSLHSGLAGASRRDALGDAYDAVRALIGQPRDASEP